MAELSSRESRERHFYSPTPKRILALDGGGVRGVISLAFLERIELLLRERTANPQFLLSDYFDLIGGASTGAIIASGLALGFPAARLIELYLTLSKQGFSRKRWMGGMLVPKFRAQMLGEAIRSQFGKETLGSDRIRCGLAILAKRLDSGSVWVFHNHPRGPYFAPDDAAKTGTPNRDLRLADLLRASTAAPTYFEPEFIEVARGVRGAFVDGGVSPHNNPALMLMMTATLEGYGFRWPVGADRLMLVSVGTGSPALAHKSEALSRMPAAWMAVQALQSMMQDCNWLVQALLQWMSQSPTPWPIDTEMGDLSRDNLFLGNPLLHYLRYDAVLWAEWLESRLGLKLDPAELTEITALDRPDLAARLLEIGRIAAAVQVTPDHFPQPFDPPVLE
jgi:predicted acylesterase/phospholipase RssA